MARSDPGDAPGARGSLLIVCCHAIYLPDAAPSSPERVSEESNWLLADFQRSTPGKEGEHLTFVRHILRAQEVARSQLPGPVHVIFSGGATKPETTKSEAQSYLDAWTTLASADGSSDGDDDDAAAAHRQVTDAVEERATDSFQNILFSLLRYNQLTDRWPEHVTVVTHAFKAERITRHLSALKWPAQRYTVEGIDPPFAEDERRAVERFERRCLGDWEVDLYGVRPPLSDKRAQRRWRPDSLVYGQMTGNGVLLQLLEWAGGEDPSALFPLALPWE